MNTQKLKKQACLNPYFINTGTQIEKIHFFGNGEIVATQNRGWLSIYGSNNSGNSALEAIEYRCKRKPDLNADYSFFIGSELYVNTAELGNFLFAPDVVQLKTDESTYYGNMVYFDCSSTDGRFAHHEIVDLKAFMVGSYSKVVPTAYGERVEAVVHAFEGIKVQITAMDARKILKNSKAIINALKD